MKNFRDYINEEMMPYAQSEKGFVGVDNGPVRDNINLLLATVTERPHATPYHALEVVRKVLAPFHIHPPATNFLDGNEGHEIFQINQFGEKMGMTNSGDVVTKDSSPYFLYFEYSMNSRGSFDIFSEIVNQEELDEILDDIEDEIEDDVTTGDGRDAEDSFDVYRAGNDAKEDIRESEEKTMPSWYAKQPGAAHREALKKEKKKEQDKKIKYAIRRLKEEQINEVGDTKKGREKLEKYAAAAHSQTGYKSKLTPKEKKRSEYSDKALAIVDKKSGKKTIRSSSPLYDYNEETQLDEISKKKLGDYIKKASHDVAARSAAVRGFARDAEAQRKDKKPMDARKSDERANKMFTKSWNRRQYIAKAVDKLTSEENSESGPENRKMEYDTNRVKKLTGVLDTIKATSGPTNDVSKITAMRDMAQRRITQNKAVNTETGFIGTIGSQDMYTSWGKEPVNMKKARTQAGIQEAQSADTHTGALTMNGKPVVSPTATTVQPDFPPKNVPVPKPRPKNLEESNPAKEGMIAAGYKGSNPAEQGAIAVKKDDEARDRKANFKVAKKLARRATKDIIKKKLTKEENLPEAKDSYAAYQRRMGVNPDKAAKKEGEWSKKIKKQEKKVILKK